MDKLEKVKQRELSSRAEREKIKSELGLSSLSEQVQDIKENEEKIKAMSLQGKNNASISISRSMEVARLDPFILISAICVNC
jgi:hypothetical protein